MQPFSWGLVACTALFLPFFFPLCPAMASFPHLTKVEAGSPLEAGEGLEFSRSHAGLQPPPRHGAQPLSRKGAYSCFLPSKTCSITSLSQLIRPLQSKKYNHCFHRKSSMHTFPFPPPCSKSRKRCCSFLSSLTSHRLCQHDGPVADPVAPQWSQIQRWRHGGIGFPGCSSGLARFSWGAGFQLVPYSGLTPGSTSGLMQT